ncbi:phage major capsid protein [Pseudonocardia sp. MH-G8]|uniref:phage major capsid protein n=1 Tax=Pseudonocardia sp. MH-G8 TaxID=1854588 RepID=UPI000BA0A731|nr:phage major capsid protein [Pseudonocardia sp. MH-G8]OZM84095.1 phage major capsid protein [Pseudonocardia sp. MH-G8]
MTLLDDLRTRRAEVRTAADEIITRAAEGDEPRDLTPDEFRAYQDRTGELREVDDRIEQLREDEVRQLRAAAARPAGADVDPHPLGTWLTRAITGASGAGAAFTPAEFPATFFDRLAAASVGLASGFAQITTARDTVTIPRWTADPSADWVAEAGVISSTDANADTITATPRKLAGLQRVSNETLTDSSPSLFERIAAGLVRSIALKADVGFYQGTGTAPQIRGLANVAGIGAVSAGANGATPANLDLFADAISTVVEANANPSVVVMHPRTWRTLLKVKETTGSAKPVLTDGAGAPGEAVRRSIYGLPVLLSSQLSTAETQGTANNASSVYVYDADQVVVVRREDVAVEIDRSRLFNSDESEIRAIARMDLVVPNPAAVVRIAGLLP